MRKDVSLALDLARRRSYLPSPFRPRKSDTLRTSIPYTPPNFTPYGPITANKNESR